MDFVVCHTAIIVLHHESILQYKVHVLCICPILSCPSRAGSVSMLISLKSERFMSAYAILRSNLHILSEKPIESTGNEGKGSKWWLRRRGNLPIASHPTNRWSICIGNFFAFLILLCGVTCYQCYCLITTALRSNLPPLVVHLFIVRMVFLKLSWQEVYS